MLAMIRPGLTDCQKESVLEVLHDPEFSLQDVPSTVSHWDRLVNQLPVETPEPIVLDATRTSKTAGEDGAQRNYIVKVNVGEGNG
jgi:hypothetical protein